MTAGKLKEEVQRLESTSLTRDVMALVLVMLGVLVAGVQFFSHKDTSSMVTLFGVVLIALGFVVKSTLRPLPRLRRLLSSYEQEWQTKVWTRENFAENLVRALPHNVACIPWSIRYADELVRQEGLGPYSRERLFFVTNTANGFEARQGSSLGLVSLIGHGCLMVTTNGDGWVYMWSPDVRDRFASLFPIPDDWEPPSDPWLYNFATGTIPHP